jgi:hypothetical protein
MPIATGHIERGTFGSLQRFVRRRRAVVEKCELCGASIAPEHQHVYALETRRITCACDPCAILFVDNTKQPYRRIPRDVRLLQDFALDDQEWDSLLIPIRLAFFVHSSVAGRVVAQYPSPGGAMESALDLEYWSAIAAKNPILDRFAPDVEALLVNRVSEPAQYYRAPIDRCYHLVGIIRSHWRGLSGGSEVWTQIDDFFRQMRTLGGASHA